MQDKLMEIQMGQIIPTANNPRHILAGDPTIRELANSIRERGLVQPVVCRPLPDGKFELLAGRRRYEAHRLLEAGTILAVVRDLDDQAALDTTVLENLQREDLDPLTEARSLQMLIDAGRNPKEIAVTLGKGYVWVYRRASLTRIVPEMVAMLEKKGLLNVWGTMHLESISSMPAEVQRDLVLMDSDNECFDVSFKPDMSASELHEQLMQASRSLREAHWKLDAILGDQPACVGCTARTDVEPELFHDEKDLGEKVHKTARCLNSKCWEAKEKVSTLQRVTELRAKHGDKLLIVGRRKAEQLELTPDIESSYHVTKCSQATPGARPALMLDSNGAKPVLTWVKPPTRDDAAAGGRQSGPKTLEVKREMLGMRRKAWVVKQVREILAREGLPTMLYCQDGTEVRPTEANLVRLLVTFGWPDYRISERFDDTDCWNWLEKAFKDHDGKFDDEIRLSLWTGLQLKLKQRMVFDEPQYCQDAFDQAVQISALLGHLSESNLMEAAADAIPDPKSWAKEALAEAAAKEPVAKSATKRGKKPDRTDPPWHPAVASEPNEHGVFVEGIERLAYHFAGARLLIELALDMAGGWHSGLAITGLQISANGSYAPRASDTYLTRAAAIRVALEEFILAAGNETNAQAFAAHAAAIEERDRQRCQICGCTDDDCRGCVELTGVPCSWVTHNLCSACQEDQKQAKTAPKHGVDAALSDGAKKRAAGKKAARKASTGKKAGKAKAKKGAK